MTPGSEDGITDASTSGTLSSRENTMTWWRSLEQRRATAFLIGGGILAIDAGIVAAEIAVGVDGWMTLGQVFVGAGWTAAFLGLLGLYPELADRSRWLARAGAVFAVIGAIVFAVMGVASLAYYAGIPDGEIEALVPLFLLGVILGSILGFVSMGVATLRTDVYSRTLGILLFIPPALVFTNLLTGIAGVDSAATTLAIVIGDALAMLAIGYVLRSSPEPTSRIEPAPGEVRRG